jgi:AraC-like DNA-binding protein
MRIVFFSNSTQEQYILVPVCANYTFIKKGFISEPHIHPVYHLVMVTSGSGFLKLNNKQFPLKEKDIVVVHPNDGHIFSSENDSGMIYFTFNFYLLSIENFKTIFNNVNHVIEISEPMIASLAECKTLDKLFNIQFNDIYINYNKHKWDEVISLITVFSGTIKQFYVNLIIEWKNRQLWTEEMSTNHFVRFFLDFYNIITIEDGNGFDGKDNHTLLNQIINYLQKNIENKYSLNELSSYLSYNPIYLCTYFKQTTGITIGQYFNKLKIYRACQYLRSTDKTITEISSILNFSSSNHFSRNFSYVKKISPRDFRKQLEVYW